MTGWSAATGRLAPGARYYAGQLGWKVFPCYGIINGKCGCGRSHPEPKDQGKHPQGALVPSGATEATSDVSTVGRWWGEDTEANIGVRCRESGFMVIDVDPRNGGHESWTDLERLLLTEGSDLPETVEAATGEYMTRSGAQRGRHLFYGVEDRESLRGAVPGIKGIDIKHNGYVLINPSRHASGLIYDWVEGKAPWERRMAPAPEALLQQLRRPGSGGSGYGVFEWGGEKVDIDALLADGIHEGERVVTLYRMACAMANTYPVQTGHGAAAVKRHFRTINATRVFPPLDEKELDLQVQRAIDFVKDNPVTNKMWPGIEDYKVAAKEWQESPAQNGSAGGGGKSKVNGVVAGAGVGVGVGSPGGTPTEVPAPPDEDSLSGAPGSRSLSDAGNGRRVVDYFGWQLRYTPSVGWFAWQGEYWVPDTEGLITREIVKELPTRIASEIAAASPSVGEALLNWARRARNRGVRETAIKDAESDTRVLVPVAKWDSYAEMLGVKNGTINLRTGDLLPPDPNLYITKQSRVAYTPGHTNVRWTEFLNFITGGDVELARYLQLAAGYTLTGNRDHECLFLVYGPAGTGKSTFLEVIGTLLGDYYIPMDSDVLVDNPQGRNSTEYHMARLMGRRMIGISEWPVGRQTKEETIKRLTGDTMMSARHPGERPFEFASQAKLWIGTNVRPQIQERAMWRRIRAINFSHVPEKSDPGLKPYLLDPEAALPAVLAWAVEGAVRLLNSPLRSPLQMSESRHVQETTEAYKKSENRLGLFLEEETRLVPGGSVVVRELFGLYRTWVEERGESVPKLTTFFNMLTEEGEQVVGGTGRDAVIEGRAYFPRAVSSPRSTDWGSLVGASRNT